MLIVSKETEKKTHYIDIKETEMKLLCYHILLQSLFPLPEKKRKVKKSPTVPQIHQSQILPMKALMISQTRKKDAETKMSRNISLLWLRIGCLVFQHLSPVSLLISHTFFLINLFLALSESTPKKSNPFADSSLLPLI